MVYVAGKRKELPLHLVEEVGRYRHKVFISQLGWPLPSNGDIESDEFDGPDAVYVSSKDKHDQVNGVARLLPTTAPYLLEKIFPSLWDGSDLPHSAEVWELSRFAAMDFITDASPGNLSSTHHAESLFRQVVKVAQESGAHTLITVSPLGVERLLRANGFRSSRAGTPMRCGREYITSLIIDIAACTR